MTSDFRDDGDGDGTDDGCDGDEKKTAVMEVIKAVVRLFSRGGDKRGFYGACGYSDYGYSCSSS